MGKFKSFLDALVCMKMPKIQRKSNIMKKEPTPYETPLKGTASGTKKLYSKGLACTLPRRLSSTPKAKETTDKISMCGKEDEKNLSSCSSIKRVASESDILKLGHGNTLELTVSQNSLQSKLSSVDSAVGTDEGRDSDRVDSYTIGDEFTNYSDIYSITGSCTQLDEVPLGVLEKPLMRCSSLDSVLTDSTMTIFGSTLSLNSKEASNALRCRLQQRRLQRLKMRKIQCKSKDNEINEKFKRLMKQREALNSPKPNNTDQTAPMPPSGEAKTNLKSPYTVGIKRDLVRKYPASAISLGITPCGKQLKKCQRSSPYATPSPHSKTLRRILSESSVTKMEIPIGELSELKDHTTVNNSTTSSPQESKHENHTEKEIMC